MPRYVTHGVPLAFDAQVRTLLFLFFNLEPMTRGKGRGWAMPKLLSIDC